MRLDYILAQQRRLRFQIDYIPANVFLFMCLHNLTSSRNLHTRNKPTLRETILSHFTYNAIFIFLLQRMKKKSFSAPIHTNHYENLE